MRKLILHLTRKEAVVYSQLGNTWRLQAPSRSSPPASATTSQLQTHQSELKQALSVSEKDPVTSTDTPSSVNERLLIWTEAKGRNARWTRGCQPEDGDVLLDPEQTMMSGGDRLRSHSGHFTGPWENTPFCSPLPGTVLHGLILNGLSPPRKGLSKFQGEKKIQWHLPPTSLPLSSLWACSHTLPTSLADNFRNICSNCLSIFLFVPWLNYNFAM